MRTSTGRHPVAIVLLIVIIVLSLGVTAGCVVLYRNPDILDALYVLPEQSMSTVSHTETESGTTDPVDDEAYLSQTVFVGDSRTHAMDVYGYVDVSKTIAEDGLNHKTALTKAFAEIGDGYAYTMKQALAITAPKYVYVGFGINGMSFLSEEEYFSAYRELIGQIRETCPDAEITILAIYPVSENFAANNPGMNNATIDAYNNKLSALADEMGIHYLDAAWVLKNDAGALNPAYSAGDGLHLNSDAYDLIFQVILANKIK